MHVPPIVILVTFACFGLGIALWLPWLAPRIETLHLILLGSSAFALTYQCFYKMTFRAYLAPTVACTIALVCIGATGTKILDIVAMWSSLSAFEMTFWYSSKDNLNASSSFMRSLGLVDFVIITSQLATLLMPLSLGTAIARGKAAS